MKMSESRIFEYLQSLGDNPYFGAGAGLFGIGLVAAASKKAGHYAQLLARRNCLISLEVNSKDHSYQWLLHWIGNRAKNRNHFSVQTVFHQSDSGKISTAFTYGPSPGIHLMWYKGWPMWVERTRETQARDFRDGMPFESITLTTIAGRSNLYSSILEEAKETALRAHEGRTKIYVPRNVEWHEFGTPRLKRPMRSVVLESGLKESLLDDVTVFLDSAEWYRSRGIPYRRGYLLHGPPGCGKSSFIFSLAGEIDYSICILNLNEQMFTDDRLSHLLVHAPPESIVLLEDIDCIFRRHDSSSPSSGDSVPPPTPQSRTGYHQGVSLSGLLNALDGVASGVGRLVFMTTNYPDLLDPALVRPGRVDRKVFVGFVAPLQAQSLFTNFFPHAPSKVVAEFTSKYQNLSNQSISPAMLQSHFMKYRESASDVIAKLEEL